MDSDLQFQAAKKIKPDAALGWIRFRLLWLEKLNEGRPRPTLGWVTLSQNHGSQRNRRPRGVGSVTEGSRVASAGCRQRPRKPRVGRRPGNLPGPRARIRIGGEHSAREPAGSCSRASLLLLDKPCSAHREISAGLIAGPFARRPRPPRARGTPRRAKVSLLRPFPRLTSLPALPALVCAAVPPPSPAASTTAPRLPPPGIF